MTLIQPDFVHPSPDAAQAAGAGPSLTADQRSLADQLVSVFENSTPDIQYGYAEALGDGRGITAGRAGFTSATGDMLELVERYTAIAPDNALATYLPRLRELAAAESGDTSGLEGLQDAWSASADDPLFRYEQDQLVDDWYYDPALAHAADIGASLPLTLMVLYDTIIQHGDGDDPDGLQALLDRTAENVGGTPATGVDEVAFLTEFLEVRRADLLNPADQASQAEWADSVGRVDTFESLLSAGNYDLTSPLVIEAYGDAFTLTPSVDTSAADMLVGDAGANHLVGSACADELYGGAGPDKLYGHEGNDLLEGGQGQDFISGGAGDDVALGGDGNDRIFAGAGDLGNDTFSGGAGDDVIGGGAGDDLIVGGGFAEGATVQLSYHARDAAPDGADRLFGGAGDDTLIGGGWDDGAVADNGHFDVGEAVTDGTDANVMWAGTGNDLLYGADGADRMGGGDGADTLYGAAGRDTLFGAAGTDALYGGAGADRLLGGAGADTLMGGADADKLFGGEGNDALDGGTGADSLWGGGGNDTLTGGAGADNFYIGSSTGNDRIADFNADEDHLYLGNASAGFTSFADVQAAASANSDGVLIDLGDGNSVFLDGVSLADLTADNVTF